MNKRQLIKNFDSRPWGNLPTHNTKRKKKETKNMSRRTTELQQKLQDPERERAPLVRASSARRRCNGSIERSWAVGANWTIARRKEIVVFKRLCHTILLCIGGEEGYERHRRRARGGRTAIKNAGRGNRGTCIHAGESASGSNSRGK